jgi:hypothetical protein
VCCCIFKFHRDVVPQEVSGAAGTGTGHPQEGAGKVTEQGTVGVLALLGSRVLQTSIERKKGAPRQREVKLGSTHKQEGQGERPEKLLSLFNNDQLTSLESQHSDFKLKKYNNRRFDKLVSLIQYMVGSSEKAIKYISSNNFEAEFAVKLYRSDRENLVA